VDDPRAIGHGDLVDLSRLTSMTAAALLLACRGPEAAPQLVVSETHACRVDGGGQVQCWHRPVGEVTSSRADDFVWPVAAGSVVHAAAGPDYMCTAGEAGEITCWGSEGSFLGRLGLRQTRTGGERVETVVDAKFVRVAAHSHTCGVTEDGRVFCWGPNFAGSLGLGHRRAIGDDEDPAGEGEVDLPVAARDVVAGHSFTCALGVDDRVRCWGWRSRLGVETDCPSDGECDENLGDDETAAEAVPVALPGPVRALAAGSDTACALLRDGSVHCWGRLARAKAGPEAALRAPALIDLGGRASAVAVGSDHACAALERGTVRCWGDNASGQLGLGHTEPIGDDESPAAELEVDPGGRAVAVGVGGSNTCVMLAGGHVRCWGFGGGTITGRLRDTDDCYHQVPNPSAGAICEPETIWEWSCSVAEHCCLGDDEPPTDLPLVPLD
jgi:alpha-tubulin suppressor-like RCC1 family protein